MAEPRAFQARFAILVGGRLGLRPGEICHMDQSWLNHRKNMIGIPRFDACTKGAGGDIPCGYCREMAEQVTEYNPEISFEEALEMRWTPKTEAAAREVPYDFDPRAALVVERFFEKYDEWPVSRTGINRRVKKAAELADEVQKDGVYPHCLRATAASYHAGRGLNAITLQSLFGWAQMSTAQNYIQQSGENTARQLRQVHSR